MCFLVNGSIQIKLLSSQPIGLDHLNGQQPWWCAAKGKVYMPDVIERQFKVVVSDTVPGINARLKEACTVAESEEIPVRFVVTSSSHRSYRCEMAVVRSKVLRGHRSVASIFDFRKRVMHRSERFNVVLIVPTGIGAENRRPCRRCWSGCPATRRSVGYGGVAPQRGERF